MTVRNVTPTPAEQIAAWAERQQERETRKAVRAARMWQVMIDGMSDPELAGLFIAAEREIARRRQTGSNDL